MTHLQYDWDSPLWCHWLDGLAEGHTLVRYDERGSGLSDRDVTRFSMDAWVEDLEAVVDEAGLERFPLLGLSVPLDRDMVELRIRLPVDEAVALEERLDRLVDLADRAERAQARQLDIEDVGAAPGGADVDPAARPSRGGRRALAVCDAVATAVAAGGPDRSGVDDHLAVLHADVHDLVEAVADTEGDAAEAPDEVAMVRRRRAGRPRSSGRRTHVATGRGRGMVLPKGVLARLTCDGDLRLAGIGENGHPADIGRRSRKVPADLRRALQLRDRHCRFPGCDATRYLHAHHVWHWALGGPTDLDNLLLLCSHHHRFVHDAGWQLRAVDPAAGRWTFHAPGRDLPVPPVLAMPGASAASSGPLEAGTPPDPYALQPPWWDGAGYDLDEALAMITDWILDTAA